MMSENPFLELIISQKGVNGTIHILSLDRLLIVSVCSFQDQATTPRISSV